jgi:uncharacterized membrane protein (UPF0127 family)
MRIVLVVQKHSEIRLGSRVTVADSWWGRLRGLLARPALLEGEGLLLMECSSVHTVGMGYPIDVAFLDADGTVVRSIGSLEPYRFGLGGPEAVHALELPAGRLEETGTVPGIRLSWR